MKITIWPNILGKMRIADMSEAIEDQYELYIPPINIKKLIGKTIKSINHNDYNIEMEVE